MTGLPVVDNTNTDNVLVVDPATGNTSRTTRADLFAGSGWSLTGNANTTNTGNLGTAATGNFIGTTGTGGAARSLSFVTDNTVQMTLGTDGALRMSRDIFTGWIVGATGVRVGSGPGNNYNNTVLGAFAFNNVSAANASAFRDNVAVGFYALRGGGTDKAGSGRNVAVGSYAVSAITDGASNVGVGTEALLTASTGSANVAVGNVALQLLTTGSGNIALGAGALETLVTGSGNVAIGLNAGNSETGSNKLYIANSATNNLIFGDFATGRVRINAGAAPTAPAAALHVEATAVGDVTVLARGISSQTGNLLEVQNSSNATLVSVNATGLFAATAGVNLSGAASPLQANGSAGTTGQVLMSAGAGATPTWTSITGLQLFEETLHTAAPNATVNALRWRPKSGTGTTDVDVVLSPKGAGALQAHVADGTAAGGNKRGQYAVDLQMQRWTNTAVASGVGSFIGGGHGNTASGFLAAVVGGNQNGAIGNYSFVGSGEDVQAQGQFSVAVGGIANQAPGDYSAILGGSDNQATGTNSSILGGYGLTLSGNYSAGFNGSGSYLSVSAASTYVLGNVNLWLANTDNTARELRFYEAQSTTNAFPATGTNYTAFKAGAQSADITYTLPTTSGTNGHVLTTNGTGTLSWTSAQSAAGIKSKGRSVALSAASTYVITGITNVDTDDGVSIVLESDLDDMDIPPYFIKRVASPTTGSITVRFSAPFTGFVTWVVVD